MFGCFPDKKSDPAIASFEGKDNILDGQPEDRMNAIEKCARAAWTKGFQVFGIKSGACFTSASAHSTYNNHGPARDCKPRDTLHVYNFTSK